MAVYDYGSGRTYATPQAALDALQEVYDQGANSAVVFAGAGLDDMTAGGTPAAGVVERQWRAQIDSVGAPDTFAYTRDDRWRANGSVAFTGTGLNDMTTSGYPDDSCAFHSMRVEIDGVGTGPGGEDTFRWSINGGAGWVASTVVITGAAQTLQDGIVITFAATTGHTLADRWDWAIDYRWDATGVAITGAAQALLEGVTATFGATNGHTLGDSWSWTTSYTIADFAETNYVRAYNGVYNGAATGEPVLRTVHSVTGRALSPTRAYQLVIDSAVGYSAHWSDDQEAGCLVNGSAAGANTVSYVRVSRIAMSCLNDQQGAIVLCAAAGGSACHSWDISSLSIVSELAAVVVGEASRVMISNTAISGYNSAGAILADGTGGTYGPYSGALDLNNVAISANGPCVSLTGDNPGLRYIHCALFSGGDNAIELLDDGASDYCVYAGLNNLVHVAADSVDCLVTDIDDLFCPWSWANFYYFPGSSAGLADINGTAFGALADWQTFTDAEVYSFNDNPEMTDPRAGDFSLASTSPARMRGRAAAPSGTEGNERAYNVDCGPAQATLGTGFGFSYAAGEATINLSARTGNVTGL